MCSRQKRKSLHASSLKILKDLYLRWMDEKCRQLLNSLDTKLKNLIEYLGSYDDKLLNTNPAPDKWSPMQIVHHMVLVEHYAQSYCKKKLSLPSSGTQAGFNPILEKANVITKLKELCLALAMRSPYLKANAPKAVNTEFLPTDKNLEETARGWKDQRVGFRKFLEEQPSALFSKKVYKHPLAGRMRFVGMLGFLEAHLDGHTRQIKGILR